MGQRVGGRKNDREGAKERDVEEMRETGWKKRGWLGLGESEGRRKMTGREKQGEDERDGRKAF